MIGFYYCVSCAWHDDPPVWSPYFNDFFIMKSYVEMMGREQTLPVRVCPMHGGTLTGSLMMENAAIQTT